MKFQVREGFIVQVATKVDLGDDRTEIQVNTYFGKQTVDLTEEQADAHFHKLEPIDKAATAYLAEKVMPVAPAQALGLTPEALALVEALALKLAGALGANAQAPAAAA